MLNDMHINMTWQQALEDAPISEPAQVVGLYRVVYMLEADLIEIESGLFDEVGVLAQQLFNDLKQLRLLTYENLEIMVCCYVAVSDFICSQPRTSAGAFDAQTYARAAKHYISPIQVLEGIELNCTPEIDVVALQNEIQQQLHFVQQRLIANLTE